MSASHSQHAIFPSLELAQEAAVAECLETLAKAGRKALVFCNTVSSAVSLAASLRANGFDGEALVMRGSRCMWRLYSDWPSRLRSTSSLVCPLLSILVPLRRLTLCKRLHYALLSDSSFAVLSGCSGQRRDYYQL